MKRIWIKQLGETSWKHLCFIHSLLEDMLDKEDGYEYHIEDLSESDFVEK